MMLAVTLSLAPIDTPNPKLVLHRFGFGGWVFIRALGFPCHRSLTEATLDIQGWVSVYGYEKRDWSLYALQSVKFWVQVLWCSEIPLNLCIQSFAFSIWGFRVWCPGLGLEFEK